MSSKLSVSLIALLALSSLGGVARADVPGPDQTAKARPHSPTAGEIDALERGNPHSVDYKNREIPRRSPTKEEIGALEVGNPDSVDYRSREIARRSPTNEEIDALEAGNPHSVNYRNRD